MISCYSTGVSYAVVSNLDMYMSPYTGGYDTLPLHGKDSFRHEFQHHTLSEQ